MSDIGGKRLYSRHESGVYLSKSLTEIDRLIKSGRIVARKDGRRTVIDRAELDRYVERLPALEPRVSA